MENQIKWTNSQAAKPVVREKDMKENVEIRQKIQRIEEKIKTVQEENITLIDK